MSLQFSLKNEENLSTTDHARKRAEQCRKRAAKINTLLPFYDRPQVLNMFKNVEAYAQHGAQKRRLSIEYGCEALCQNSTDTQRLCKSMAYLCEKEAQAYISLSKAMKFSEGDPKVVKELAITEIRFLLMLAECLDHVQAGEEI